MAGAPTIGIVGGGQLGRMLTLAALPLGFKVVVVDPGDNPPAAQAGAEAIKAPLYDKTALQKLAQKADYLTIEIEHLDASVLQELADAGAVVNPAPRTIGLIQDKFEQKEFLAAAGIPVASFAKVTTLEEALAVWQKFGQKALIKTRHGAYDGRGNMVVTSEKEVQQAWSRFEGQQVYMEAFVPFQKELAVMVAKDMEGQLATYPVVETIHQRNICLEVRAPADVSQKIARQATLLAEKVAAKLEGAGVFGIELFLTKDNELLVNEIAPRVHNSGHYTMDACHVSQFEQHIRAISGLPLGTTSMTVPAAVMSNILGERNGPVALMGLEQALAIPHTSVHLYGKSPTKFDRKMGHITSTGKHLPQAKKRAREARRKLSI